MGEINSMKYNLRTATEKMKFDIRLLETHLKKEEGSTDEYQQYLSQLPDLIDECTQFKLGEFIGVGEVKSESEGDEVQG